MISVRDPLCVFDDWGISETASLNSCVALNDEGFVKTALDLTPEDLDAAHWPLKRQPWLFETRVPRVFAVGDVRPHNVKRVASAVGEGSVAVQLIHRALSKRKGERKRGTERRASAHDRTEITCMPAAP
jgi:hypothetical protein